jgi:hypothetical protein
MRQFSAHTLAPLLGVLLAVTMVAACGGDGDSAAPRHGPASSERSTRATEQEVVTANPPTTVPVTEAPAAPADSPGPVAPASPPATSAPAPAPAPSGGLCDTAAVHDAIAGAVAPDLAFEVTYLECAEGYGWAQVLADFGDGATAFLQGSGSDITVLDLGSAVCPTAAGMPESIAVQLAPAGSAWRGECGPA